MGHEVPCNNCRRPRFTITQRTSTMPQDTDNKIRITKEMLCGYCGQLIKREIEDVTQE